MANIIDLLDSEEIEISDFLMDRFAEIILTPLFTNQAWRLFKTGSHSCSRAIGCDIIAIRPQTICIPIRLELELCSHHWQLGIFDTSTGIISADCALGLKYKTSDILQDLEVSKA